MLLMKDVLVAVAPVWIQILVLRSRCNRCIVRLKLLAFGTGFLTLSSLEIVLEGGGEVHLVGVDDLVLLFKIESFFVVARGRGFLAHKLLLVVADGHGGVRVPDEVIDATGLPTDLRVARWKLLDYNIKNDVRWPF